MAVTKLYDLARMTTATTGNGTLTLGLPVPPYLSFAGAGVQDGDTVRYAIYDPTNGGSEIGTGVYTASGTTLTRVPTSSTNGNAAIFLSGLAPVFITASKLDFYPANDTSAVSGVATTFFNPSYYSVLSGGVGIVERVNRGLFGVAALQSSDISNTSPYLPTTPTWPDTLLQAAFVGLTQVASISSIGDQAILGASRASDWRAWAGSAAEGTIGVTGIGYNDDTLSLVTNNTTASGNATLHFVSVPGYVTAGMLISDITTPSVIAVGRKVLSTTSTTVVMDGNASGAGVGSGDTIVFGAGSVALGFLGLGIRGAHVGGETLGAQFDACNSGSVVDQTPFSSAVGATFSAGFTAGAEAPAVANTTAAFYIGYGDTISLRHRKGILFLEHSLDTGLGAGGDGMAMQFARGMSLHWANSTPGTDAEIWGDANGFRIAATAMSLNTSAPLVASGYGIFTTDGSSGSIASFNVNGTETFRLQVVPNNVQIVGTGSSTTLSFTTNGGTSLNYTAFPSSGNFMGASPSDPGANNLAIAGALLIGSSSLSSGVQDLEITNFSLASGNLSAFYGQSVTSVVMSDFEFFNEGVITTGVDSGATRAVARQLGSSYFSYPASTHGAAIRASEHQTLRGAGVPFAQTWGQEVGVHNASPNTLGLPYVSAGINIGSSHTGWLNAPITLTGTTNNTNVITGLSSTAGLLVGMTVSGTGIPIPTAPSGLGQPGEVYTTITSIDSATQIHISAAATNSATETLTFGAAVRNDYGIIIGGEDGFCRMMTYFDTNSSTVLWDVDQFGNQYTKGAITTPFANLTVYTVTTLPSTGRAIGSVALVSDATSNVLIGTGGGSAYALVTWTGSAWVAV